MMNITINGKKLAVAEGETRQLRVEILDAADRPALVVGEKTCVFPVTLKRGDHLRCLDGVHWDVSDARRETIARGELSTPLPALTKTAEVSFATADDAHAAARILISTKLK